MFVLTIICTWAWNVFVDGQVYACADGGPCDYWTPGDWVHNHVSQAIEVVPQIHQFPHLGDPDVLKTGWSVTRLWCVWILFFGGSLIVSMLFAYVSWIATLTRLFEGIRRR